MIWRGQHFWAGSAEPVGSNRFSRVREKAVGLFWGALKRGGEGGESAVRVYMYIGCERNRSITYVLSFKGLDIVQLLAR